MLASRVRMGVIKDKANPNLMKGTGSLATSIHVASGVVTYIGEYGGVDNVFQYTRPGYWAVLEPQETYTNIQSNTLYTFSVLIKPTNINGIPTVHFSANTGGYVALNKITEHEDFFLYTRTFNSNYENGSTWRVHLNLTALGNCYISTNMKLEVGTIATKWVPHISEK